MAGGGLSNTFDPEVQRASSLPACRSTTIDASYRAQQPSDQSKRIRKRTLHLARKFPRYGHRRLTAELRREGWIINRKCVRRICRDEGLKITIRARKRRRGGRAGQQRAVANGKNHVWSYDFLFDRLQDGRQLKILRLSPTARVSAWRFSLHSTSRRRTSL